MVRKIDSEPAQSLPQESESFRPAFSSLALIGQLANAYILLEAPDGLILVDQHAAHERIIYNGLCQRSKSGFSQRLIRPVVLDLLPREARSLKKWIASIRELGFEIEPFGGSSFVIHAAPAVLSGISAETLVRDFLKTAEDEAIEPTSDIAATFSKTAACHRAVRAGQKLSIDEISVLLKLLDTADLWETCPHGRPVWQKLPFSQISKLFLRS